MLVYCTQNETNYEEEEKEAVREIDEEVEVELEIAFFFNLMDMGLPKLSFVCSRSFSCDDFICFLFLLLFLLVVVMFIVTKKTVHKKTFEPASLFYFYSVFRRSLRTPCIVSPTRGCPSRPHFDSTSRESGSRAVRRAR